MPTPGPIRKEILQALESTILPALWQRDVPLGCVVPPLLFPPGINARLLHNALPRSKVTGDIEYPLQSCWPKAHLQSSHHPYFGFLYEGAADERTLVTGKQAAKCHLSKGIYAIRWQAPSMLLFPPGAPRNDGNATFWYGETPAPSKKILWLSVGPEILVHSDIKGAAGQGQSQHSLQISDPLAMSLSGLFIKELQNTDIGNQQLARAILLSLMLCLQKFLHSGRAKIANTSYSPLPEFGVLPDEPTSQLCREVAIYIEGHLHEALTLPDIAAQAGFSPVHLNRLFRRHFGATVMHYVRAHRIAAAKGILKLSSENIAEIAYLVGFKRANIFCRAFRGETGMTPGQYRRSARRGKGIPHDGT